MREVADELRIGLAGRQIGDEEALQHNVLEVAAHVGHLRTVLQHAMGQLLRPALHQQQVPAAVEGRLGFQHGVDDLAEVVVAERHSVLLLLLHFPGFRRQVQMRLEVRAHVGAIRRLRELLASELLSPY